jgi:PAS domain S-box-containing protein
MDFLSGGGSTGALMRSTDWSQTPIGPLETWPYVLRTMVSFLLSNPLPLVLWWGPRYCQLYNDRFRPVLRDKHPRSMGQPGDECFPEIWHAIRPLIDTPFQGGPATRTDDLLMEYHKGSGFLEEAHLTIDYSPVPDPAAPNGIGGVLATFQDVTEKVLAERRQIILRDLVVRSSEAKTAIEACSAAAETMGRYPRDIPFAVLYLSDTDQKRARLAATAGFDTAGMENPAVVDLEASNSDGGVWPLADTLYSRGMVVVENLRARLASVPRGPWPEAPRSAVVCPISSGASQPIAGFLVLGISARLSFNGHYRDFCALAASQVATAVDRGRTGQRVHAVVEEAFRKNFDLGLIGMAIASPELRCIDVNEETCKLLGYEREELLGKSVEELTHPNDREACTANVGLVTTGAREGFLTEKRWIHKSGRPIYCNLSVKCLRREDGTVDCFIAFLQDITARKQATQASAKSYAELKRQSEERIAQLTAANQELRTEIGQRKWAQEKLRRGEAYLAAAQKLTNVGSWAWNVSTGEVFWSAEVFRMFEVDPETFRPSRDKARLFIHPDDLERAEAILDRAAAEQISVDADFRVVVSGTVKYLHHTANPVLDQSGALVEMVGAIVDITEHRRAQVALLRSQEELRELTHRLMEAQETGSKQLARELHDDFSQRLAVLGIEVEVLAARASTPELGARLIEVTSQLAALADDIHAISRQLHPAILDELGLTAALKRECSVFSAQYGVPVQFHSTGSPPSLPENISLGLYRIAQECLQYAARRAKTSEVRIELSGDDHEVVMELAGSAASFDVETIREMRDPEFIGIEERARLLHGTISFQPQPGEATRIQVRVPLQRN